MWEEEKDGSFSKLSEEEAVDNTLKALTLFTKKHSIGSQDSHTASRKAYSKDDDKKILEFAKQFEGHPNIPFGRLDLPGRNEESIKSRYYHHLKGKTVGDTVVKPERHGEGYSPAEDETIFDYVKPFLDKNRSIPW